MYRILNLTTGNYLYHENTNVPRILSLEDAAALCAWCNAEFSQPRYDEFGGPFQYAIVVYNPPPGTAVVDNREVTLC